MQCWGLRPTLDSRSDSDGLFFTTGGIEEGQHVCYLAVCPVPIPTHSPIPCLCSDQILYPLGFWGLGKVQSRLYQHIQCSSMIILCATGTKMTPFLFFFSELSRRRSPQERWDVDITFSPIPNPGNGIDSCFHKVMGPSPIPCLCCDQTLYPWGFLGAVESTIYLSRHSMSNPLSIVDYIDCH